MWLAVAMVVSACGSNSGGESTTSTSGPARAGDGRVTVTSSLPPDQRVSREIPTRFEPGVLYSLPYMMVDTTLLFSTPGWETRVVGQFPSVLISDRFMVIESPSSADTPGAVMQVIFHDSDTSTTEVAQQFESWPRRLFFTPEPGSIVPETSESRPAEVGPHSGVTFDLVFGGEERGDESCVDVFLFEIGEQFMGEVLLEGCTWHRLWIVDVEENPVLITGSPGLHYEYGTARPVSNHLDELEPAFDEFIAALKLGD